AVDVEVGGAELSAAQRLHHEHRQHAEEEVAGGERKQRQHGVADGPGEVRFPFLAGDGQGHAHACPPVSGPAGNACCGAPAASAAGASWLPVSERKISSRLNSIGFNSTSPQPDSTTQRAMASRAARPWASISQVPTPFLSCEEETFNTPGSFCKAAVIWYTGPRTCRVRVSVGLSRWVRFSGVSSATSW